MSTSLTQKKTAYGMKILEALSAHVEMTAEEMSSLINLEALSKKEKKEVVSRVKLPWCGEVREDMCQGVRLNHGLYTQCSGEKEEGSYCMTCGRNGGPKYGDISRRNDDDFAFMSKVVRYSKVMEKLGITREEAEEAASAEGWTIQESEFEKVAKGRRGRPRKLVDTSSSDSDTEPKKRGRPKKHKAVVMRSTGEDLIASLMASAQLEDDKSDTDLSIEKEEKVVCPMSSYAVSLENAEQFESEVLAEEAAKEAAKQAAKQAKEAAKQAAKQAKEAAKQAKEAEKQAKLEAKEAEKQAKEAEKQAKLEAKEAEKQAKLDAKEAEKQAKLEAKEAEKQAKLEAKEAEKQAKLEAKEAEKQAKLAAKLEAKAEKQAAKLAEKEAAKAEKQAAKLAENESTKVEELTEVENTVFSEATEELTEVENTVFSEATEELTEVENLALSQCEESPGVQVLDAPTLNLKETELELFGSEEEEEDGEEVEEFTYEGVDYILSPSSGILYDKEVFEESGEASEVGNYCSESGEVTLSSPD